MGKKMMTKSKRTKRTKKAPSKGVRKHRRSTSRGEFSCMTRKELMKTSLYKNIKASAGKSKMTIHELRRHMSSTASRNKKSKKEKK